MGFLMVDTKNNIGSREPLQPKSAAAGAPEAIITPEMVEAGVQVLKNHYLDLDDCVEYPAIVHIVYAAMVALRPQRARIVRQKRC